MERKFVLVKSALYLAWKGICRGKSLREGLGTREASGAQTQEGLGGIRQKRGFGSTGILTITLQSMRAQEMAFHCMRLSNKIEFQVTYRSNFFITQRVAADQFSFKLLLGVILKKVKITQERTSAIHTCYVGIDQ